MNDNVYNNKEQMLRKLESNLSLLVPKRFIKSGVKVLELNNSLEEVEEMLEEWDWDKASPTGKAVSRNAAHQKGIPHEGVHLWVIRLSGSSPAILFQHRAMTKSIYPDCLDITVGGHVPYGIYKGKIQKESFEEIGIKPLDEELVDLGYYRYEEITDGMLHREFQHVYLYIDNRPLNEYRFIDGEVDGIYGVLIDDLLLLLKKEYTFTVQGYDGVRILERKVSRNEFHPFLFFPSMKVYMDVIITAVQEIVRDGFVAVKMPSPV